MRTRQIESLASISLLLPKQLTTLFNTAFFDSLCSVTFGYKIKYLFKNECYLIYSVYYLRLVWFIELFWRQVVFKFLFCSNFGDFCISLSFS